MKNNTRRELKKQTKNVNKITETNTSKINYNKDLITKNLEEIENDLQFNIDKLEEIKEQVKYDLGDFDAISKKFPLDEQIISNSLTIDVLKTELIAQLELNLEFKNKIDLSQVDNSKIKKISKKATKPVTKPAATNTKKNNKEIKKAVKKANRIK